MYRSAAAALLALPLVIAAPAAADTPAEPSSSAAPSDSSAAVGTGTVIDATASLASLVHGQSVVVRYTVSGDGIPLAGVPTTIRYGGKRIAMTTDAAGRGALNIRDLPVGRAAVIVQYAGGGAHPAGSATLWFTVTPRPTAISSLTPAVGSRVSGDSVIVRFVVSGAGKPLAGVRTGITAGGATHWATSGPDGRVARTIPLRTVGTVPILVRYLGDAAHAPAAATTRVTRTNPCPAVAKACIDLTHDVTWIQDQGTVVYGPVPITSGRPGYRTRPGTFRVYWKNKNHISSIFNAPMPNSIFFDGGNAFHEGSLAIPSHGCIHLSRAASGEFWNRLRIGDGVYVWGSARY
jgi:lipoprotein-anchoring transpeptidase ErfK/SrfK